jgi:hypothetical protein
MISATTDPVVASTPMTRARYGVLLSCPGNARIVAAWFPTAERGTASAIFNSAQYFSTALFAPFTRWLTYRFGWEYGVLGHGSDWHRVHRHLAQDDLQPQGAAARLPEADAS